MTVEEYNELSKRMAHFKEIEQKLDNFEKCIKRMDSDRFESVQITVNTSPYNSWNVYLEPFMLKAFKHFLMDQCDEIKSQLLDI